MKDKLTCYIIEDEHLAQEILEAYIAKVPFLELKGTFISPLEAAGHLAADKPDLLFLDINMPDLDGLSFIPMLNPKPMIILTTAYDQYALKAYDLEVKGTFMSPLEAAAEMPADKPNLLFLDINMPDLDGLSFIPMLNPKPMIILTTAYDQYALKAYDLEVKDYLLKPFTFERFYKAVLRLYQEKSPPNSLEKKEEKAETKTEQEYIFLKVGHRIQKVATRDILFVEGMKDYLRIHTREEKIMTLLNFAKLEKLLPAQDFARVHRSFLVSLDKIDHIEKNRIQIADHLIPISDTYAEAFYNMLRGLQ